MRKIHHSLTVLLTLLFTFSCTLLQENTTDFSFTISRESFARAEAPSPTPSVNYKIECILTGAVEKYQEVLLYDDETQATFTFEQVPLKEKINIEVKVFKFHPEDASFGFVYEGFDSIILQNSNETININLKEPPFLRGQGDIAKNSINFGGKSFAKTSEVVIIPQGLSVAIEGSNDYYTSYFSNASANYTGVFIQDRTVILSSFVMGAYEVTQELYEAVIGSNPSLCNSTQEDYKNMLSGESQELRPVEYVTWYDAVNFCNELTKKTMSEDDCVYTITNQSISGNNITSATVSIDTSKKGYRLPTEAEWEFAARGGNPINEKWKYAFAGVQSNNNRYNWTNNGNYDSALADYAWYTYTLGGEDNKQLNSKDPGYGTHEVGKKLPNTLGLYDMSGNVSEWCYDWYGTLSTGDEVNPLGTSSGNNKILRGGYWAQYGYYMCVSHRNSLNPSVTTANYGFRIARSF